MSPWVSLRFLQTQTDDRLLAAARLGHERAFEALVSRYRQPLLRYCRRLLSSDAKAEDALQQGLLQAWISLERGTEVRDAKPWLYRIVHNAALDIVRRSPGEQEPLGEWVQVGDSVESEVDRRIAVRAALTSVAALPGAQREAFLQTAVHGRSHEHVAAALGISDGSVRGLVYRARAALRATATAITPPPMVAWAAAGGRHAGPLAQRLDGVGAGAGSAGIAGLVLKSGTAVVTAGVLAAGVTTIKHQLTAAPQGRSGGGAAGHAAVPRSSALVANPATVLAPAGAQGLLSGSIQFEPRRTGRRGPANRGAFAGGRKGGRHADVGALPGTSHGDGAVGEHGNRPIAKALSPPGSADLSHGGDGASSHGGGTGVAAVDGHGGGDGRGPGTASGGNGSGGSGSGSGGGSGSDGGSSGGSSSGSSGSSSVTPSGSGGISGSGGSGISSGSGTATAGGPGPGGLTGSSGSGGGGSSGPGGGSSGPGGGTGSTVTGDPTATTTTGGH